MNSHKRMNSLRLSLVIFLKIFFILFIIEVAINLLLQYITFIPQKWTFAINFLLLPILSVPILYFFIIRDLIKKNIEIESLQRLTMIDSLTEIANRRCFDQTFKREWKYAMRYQFPLSLLLIDIDHFKEYNDHFGHQKGDECLKVIANAIEGTLRRPTDLAARIGGEEFAVILPATDPEGCRSVAEKIHAKINNIMINHPKSDVKNHITVSIGASTILPTPTDHSKDFIMHTDQNLYQAKNEGRNRTVFS